MKSDRERRPILLRRTKSGLEPASAIDAEALEEYSLGSEIEVTLKARRSRPEMRFYWATLARIVAAIDRPEFPDAERLHDELKVACGYVEKRVSLNGAAYYVPDSIAFGRMDAKEFQGFKARAWRLIREQFDIDPETVLEAA